MSAGPIPRSWRRYLRLSVGGLIILVLLIGAALGWLVRSARIQRDTVAAINKAHGRVLYDWEFKEGRRTPDGRPRWQKWLVDHLGVEYFNKGLTGLELLGLSNNRITDEGFAHPGGLTNLHWLDPHGTPIESAGYLDCTTDN